MKTKIVSWLLALAMLLSLMPVSALAADRDPDSPQVRVIVENTTFSMDAGAAWDGTLVDTWVDVDEASTVGSCLIAALAEYGYTQSGAESNYGTDTTGVGEFTGGMGGGWMVTVNDWFINEGVEAFTVADGKLEAGDEIKMIYTMEWGMDVGSDWSNNDKTVAAIEFSAGTLDQAFQSDEHEYVLTVPAGTTGVIVTPTATNKNFQVRAYDNDSAEYKRNDTIPIADGDVLLVICGDPEWPSMNSQSGGTANDVPAEVYLFEVQVEEADPDLFFTVDLTDYATPLYAGIVLNSDYEDENNLFLDEESISAGQKAELSFPVAQYDQYIIAIDYAPSDGMLMGWNVNGVNYLIVNSAANDDYWDLGNDAGVGYTFDLEGDQGVRYDEFYLILGLEGVYSTTGSWVITPVLMTEEILDVIDAIEAIGEVTLESGDDISAAWTLYNALSGTDKELVSNLDVLEAAEDDYNALSADKAAADIVVGKINTIGTVTLDAETNITEARSAYNALTDAQKAFVGNYATLTAAETKLAELKADKAAADAVAQKINAIGTVTLESESTINDAWAAYNSLSVAQKSLVTNYATLTAAQETLTQLKNDAAQAAADKAAADAVVAKISAIGTVALENEETITTARAAYDALTNAQKAMVANYETLTAAEATLAELKEAAAQAAADKAAADAVIEKIAAIGTVTLEDEAAIAAARAAYHALTDTQKALVTNYEALTAAEAELVVLKKAAAQAAADKTAADKVIGKINTIGEVTLKSENAITAARTAYDALTDAQKKLVSNYAVLTKAEETIAQLQKDAAQAAEDRRAATTAEEKITAIGDVTVFSGKKVTAARDAYDALTTAQKALVSNYSTLTAAESALKELYKSASDADHKTIFEATGKYIAGLGAPYVGDTGGEWMVIDLTRAGYSCPEEYYQRVVEYVKSKINDKEQLHRAKGTDNARVILALTAAGYDVTNVAGHNLLMGLTDMTYVQYQGINGPIWALIAFDCHNYEIPTNPNAAEQVTREKLIEYILDKQLADGGWALTGNNADADMTGMAIQALAPYYSTNTNVKTAVDAALALLSAKQNDMGGFGSVDGYSTESCAQIIVALTTLGIDPETDPRFVKNGISVVDAMCLLAIENGGFAHIPGGQRNGMATEQGQYALAAYFRFKNGQTALYDMSDVTIAVDDNPKTGDSAQLTLMLAVMLLSLVGMAALLPGKKYR